MYFCSLKKKMFFESRSGGMVDTRDLKSLAHCGRVGSSPTFGTQAEVAQLVEHDLAKVGVASSSLVFRSKSYKAIKISKLQM